MENRKNLDFKLFDLYKQMIETIPIHIYWKNLQFEYVHCNALQAQNSGLSSPEEIIGKTDYDLFTKDQADIIRKNDIEVISTRTPHVFEEEAINAYGINHTYLTQKVPLINAEGRVTGLAGISINITQRAIKEHQIRHEKENIEMTFASILENLPGHVYWKNKELQFQGCNLAQAKSAGFNKPEDMIGKTDYEMPWVDEAEELRASDLVVLNTQEAVTTEEASLLAHSDKLSFFLSKKARLYTIRKEK